jgi:lipid A 3-O-deacylase
MRQASICVILLALLASAGPALAGFPDEPMMSFSVGRMGLFDDVGDPAEFGIAYRFHSYGKWRVVPAVGVVLNNDAAYFIYSELRREFWPGGRWLLSPSFGVGLYDKGRVFDLGHTVEFRSGIELGYRVANSWRVGLAFFHLSNGGIGDRNPGTEALVLSVSVPLPESH